LIATDGLTKRYPGGVTALDGLTVEIEPGIVGLVGSNGAGKSTLLKILLGLLEPSSGSATIFDLPVATRGIQIRELVGYMPEHDCLPPDMTATDIVSHLALISGLPKAAARERTAEVLRHVGLYEERYRAIGGYSTGMKQRVKLAQALVHDPRLLLLDEPTNGLDPAGIVEIRELIKLLPGRGTTVLVCSHLLAEVELMCDRATIIRRGRLVAEGTIAELLADYGKSGYVARVHAVDAERAEHVLVRSGLLAAQLGGGRISVTGPVQDGEQISRPLAEAGIYVSELRNDKAHLEQVFLSLTSDHDEATPHLEPIS
jgi:ABC-2 type transport system ATP-binding protein